jgi:hypothetical protein
MFLDKLGIKINAEKNIFAICVRTRIATADSDLGEAKQSADPEHWPKRAQIQTVQLQILSKLMGFLDASLF